jgi:NDP-sugar pyrophosphorylase family protein
MRAVILAGGAGRRLLPYTTVLPKPLMPVGERPILEIVIGQLRSKGFDHLTLAVGYLHALIEAYFGDGSNFGVRIEYSTEKEPLGTAGPLSLLGKIDEDFLVMNGDILTDLNFEYLMAKHKESGAIATLGVYSKPVKIELGVLEIEGKNRVVDYVEKPTLHYDVSTGIYCFRPDVLDYLVPAAKCDLPELVLRIIRERQLVNALRYDGYWLDIGNPSDYEIAIKEVEAGRF